MKAFALKSLPRLPRLAAGAQVVIVILVIGLFGALAIEPTRQLIEQRERISGMSTDLDRLERSNERLEARIERLKDPDYLEQRAREQVGLIRPGETTYVVMPPRRSADAAKKGAAEKVAAPERPVSFLEGFLAFIGL
jgi:cell division protein FtsB